MEVERYRGSREVVRRPTFQRKYLSRLVAMLRRRRIETSNCASARIRAVKLAADLSLAMTSRCRTAWSRAIVGKYLFRYQKSHYQLRVVKSRGNLHGIRRLPSADTRRNKTTSVGKKFRRPLLTTASRTGNNCEEEAGGTVPSRMQTLRLLIPGSRGLDTAVFLQEAADYILALKKQVRAMQALVDCYANSSARSTCQI